MKYIELRSAAKMFAIYDYLKEHEAETFTLQNCLIIEQKLIDLGNVFNSKGVYNHESENMGRY